MGRPRKFQSKDFIGLILPSELKKAVENEARRRGITVSELIRQAISNYLNLDPIVENDPDPLQEVICKELIERMNEFRAEAEKLVREKQIILREAEEYERKSSSKYLISITLFGREFKISTVYQDKINSLISRAKSVYHKIRQLKRKWFFFYHKWHDYEKCGIKREDLRDLYNKL